jgi:restriction system protein
MMGQPPKKPLFMPPLKSYRRVMLGRKSMHAPECFAGNFIGAGFGINEDLAGRLPDSWREFNKEFVPKWLALHPGKSKISAGLSCGALWVVCKGLKAGDVVLCPDGAGKYRVGEIAGDYQYAPGGNLPHRRPVRWLDVSIPRESMSEALQNSTGSIGTVSDVSGHSEEIERLIGSAAPPSIVATDTTIEDPVAFAMEAHLEDFLVANWEQMAFGKTFTIFEEEGEPVGKQYETDAGRIDILAVSKDKTRLLVIELKRGRTSDVVVGQLLRYMGYVKEQLAEPEQSVEGVIIGLEDDQKLRWAIAPVPSIKFFRYQVNFRLIEA